MSDYLPGAVRKDKPNAGAFTRQPSILVLHSTEGSGWPEYTSNDAPHLTVSIADREVRQHVPFTKPARALKNRAGGVETNRAGCVQVEIIGTCDQEIAQDHGVLYLPDLHDDQLAWLALILHEVHEATGIPLASSVEWRDYKNGKPGGSYGLKNGLRLTSAEWHKYRGVLGHMHVPENDHGDPGSLNVGRLLLLANAVKDVGAPSVLSTPTATVAASASPQADPLARHLLTGFPLPPGHWFGLEAKDSRVHSGATSARDRTAIAQMVQALGRRGWNTPDDSKGFTRQVYALVRAYQNDARLTVDGKAGPVTWTSISQSPIRK